MWFTSFDNAIGRNYYGVGAAPTYAKTHLSPLIALVLANELAAHPPAEPAAFWDGPPSGPQPDIQRFGRYSFQSIHRRHDTE